jgi:hypothetical protein
MPKIVEHKTEYAFFGEGEETTDFLISISKGNNPCHGPIIKLVQNGKAVRFPAAFADVIKEWAKS